MNYSIERPGQNRPATFDHLCFSEPAGGNGRGGGRGAVAMLQQPHCNEIIKTEGTVNDQKPLTKIVVTICIHNANFFFFWSSFGCFAALVDVLPHF